MFKQITLFFVAFLISNSINAMEGPVLDWKEHTQNSDKNNLHAAMFLNTPFIRQSIENYASQRGTNPKKMVLGAGHIYNIHLLHPEYQEKGSNSLTSDYSDGYDFHQHKDWYTASAEVDTGFGSDFVLDLRNSDHLNTLFSVRSQNFWDIVFDESYHPGVFTAPGLIAHIAHGLKKGGVYIFTLPLKKKGDFFVVGQQHSHTKKSDYFVDKIYNGDVQFGTIDEAEQYLSTEMGHLGFTEVRLYQSPITQAFIQCLGSPAAPKELPDDLPKIFSVAKSFTEQTQAAQIDPLFRDVGLGMYYGIAKK